MKNKIIQQLPIDRHTLETINYKEFFICDWKDVDRAKGGVEIYNAKPQGIKCVKVNNDKEIAVIFDGFGENALPEGTGLYCKQCECLLFPEETTGSWTLFIETKYANDEKLAFRKEHDYPNNMVNQIIQTVLYFRRKGIIGNNQKIHAIASFPNLEIDYQDMLFRVLEESDKSPSIEEIKRNYNIIVKATNTANIISAKRIKLTSN